MDPCVKLRTDLKAHDEMLELIGSDGEYGRHRSPEKEFHVDVSEQTRGRHGSREQSVGDVG